MVGTASFITASGTGFSSNKAVFNWFVILIFHLLFFRVPDILPGCLFIFLCQRQIISRSSLNRYRRTQNLYNSAAVFKINGRLTKSFIDFKKLIYQNIFNFFFKLYHIIVIRAICTSRHMSLTTQVFHRDYMNFPVLVQVNQ